MHAAEDTLRQMEMIATVTSSARKSLSGPPQKKKESFLVVHLQKTLLGRLRIKFAVKTSQVTKSLLAVSKLQVDENEKV